MIQWTNAEGIQGRLQQNPFFSTSEDLSHVFLLPIQKISEQPCSNGESIRHTVLWEGLQTEDLVDKFSIVFLMVKERISFNSFPNMSRGVSWTKNTEGVIDSTQVQYCVVGGCGEECGKEGEYY